MVLSVAGTARQGYVSSQPIPEASGSLAEPPAAFNHIRISPITINNLPYLILITSDNITPALKKTAHLSLRQAYRQTNQLEKISVNGFLSRQTEDSVTCFDKTRQGSQYNKSFQEMQLCLSDKRYDKNDQHKNQSAFPIGNPVSHHSTLPNRLPVSVSTFSSTLHVPLSSSL